MTDQPGNSNGFVPAGFHDEFDDDDYLSYTTSSSESFGNKIRIVRGLGYEAGLDKQNFPVTLPDDVHNWLETFTKQFNMYKKGPVISHGLRMFFGTRNDLFEIVLKIYANVPSCTNPKSTTLAYVLIQELHDYLASIGPELVKEMQKYGLTDNLKTVAFNFFNAHGKLFTIVTKCYDLTSSRNIFLEPIREMINAKKYKDACQIATDLELFSEFSIHDFLIPLILQDRMTVAETYLAKAKLLQEPLVTFLDTWLDHTHPLPYFYDIYLGNVDIMDVNYSKLHRKTLKKLVKRYAEMFKIDKKLTPFLLEMDAYGMLQLFISKKYVEKSLGDWDEYIKESVQKTYERLIEELINACIDYNDLPEAAKWLHYFQCDLDKFPPQLRKYLEGKNSENDSDDDVVEVPLYVDSYTIDETKIHLIDNVQSYYQMIGDLVRFTILGFDAEWKFGEPEIDLIQLANIYRIYLLDVTVLKGILSNADWRKLGRKIFNNEEILKLGFSQASDISMLKKTLPGLSLTYEKSTSYMDLQKLWRHMLEIPGFRFPYPDSSCGRAKQDLRQLVTLCLGRPLDKSQQFSNWAKRPLTQPQIVYAAADAYCLIEIYNVLKYEAQRLHIDLYDYDLCAKLK